MFLCTAVLLWKGSVMRYWLETLKYLHIETIQENYSMNDKGNAKVIKTIETIKAAT